MFCETSAGAVTLFRSLGVGLGGPHKMERFGSGFTDVPNSLLSILSFSLSVKTLAEITDL